MQDQRRPQVRDHETKAESTLRDTLTAQNEELNGKDEIGHGSDSEIKGECNEEANDVKHNNRLTSFARSTIFKFAVPFAWKTFFYNFRRALVATLLFEIVLGLLFYRFEHRYLLPRFVYYLLAVLLPVTVIGWHSALSGREASLAIKWKVVLASTATCVWIGVLGWQVWTVLNPVNCSPGAYCIAIALLGQEDLNYRSSESGRNVSNLLLRALERQYANEDGSSDTIEIRLFGVISSSTQAEYMRKHIGAHLVIWGRLQREQLDICINTSPQLNQIDNPDIPQPVPIMGRTLVSVVSMRYDDVDTIERILEQIQGISQFELGLAYFFSQDSVDPNFRF
ncbi:hypothetical protein KFU94_38705 [Chloroflexi bacterium TSY]|nr:hypothetical protein [Chloroflexi bacterium TSY]